MDPETIAILNVIVEIIIAVLVIIAPIGIIGGIIAIATTREKEPPKKRLYTVWGIVAIVAPIILLFVILSLWGLIRILSNTFAA